MPPKKGGGQTKAEAKSKAKAAEDKTFGLKNKNKSAKVNRYVQQVQAQAQGANSKAAIEKAKAKEVAEAKKAQEQKKQQEIAELFKPVQVAQKVPFGTDPKTVLCQYFKAGHCEKGSKCKFSHDTKVERKAAKIDLYTDARQEEKKNDTMDQWDQKKLEQVVLSKDGNPKTTTDIVCKFFLEAVESGLYGWFWECPNGGKDCKYRHALPPGFVLKSKQKKEEKDEISLEDFLETERHKLGKDLTPVTAETFAEWKKNRLAKQDAAEEVKRKAKESQWKAGKSAGMSGKDLFEFNPDWANDGKDEYDEGDDVFDLSAYHRQDDEEESANQANGVANGVQDMSLNEHADGQEPVAVNSELFLEEEVDDLSDDE